MQSNILIPILTLLIPPAFAQLQVDTDLSKAVQGGSIQNSGVTGISFYGSEVVGTSVNKTGAQQYHKMVSASIFILQAIPVAL
jgi:hypothetical protein